MIANALDLITDELKVYVDNTLGVNTVPVVLDNISNLETDTSNLENRVIISLVNIEEESVYKNVQSIRKNAYSGSVEYLNPPVYLNLYILFSATVLTTTSPAGRYLNALSRLSLIVKFFQNNRCFTVQNSPNSTLATMANDPPINPAIHSMKIIMDLYTLTFEQLNHLWGSLGGKQVPAVMYKARLIQIQEEQVQKGGGIITEIQTTETLN